MFCEICNKPESKWNKSANPFIFVFTLKNEDSERCLCPECTLQRLIELSKESE